MNIKDYKDTGPEFILEDYFAGKTTAYGVFQDRFGKVRRRFTVDIIGEWNEAEQKLVLTEDFVYDDGQEEQRIWTLTKTGENTYEGTAPNVIGMAKGETSGNAFHWEYDFNLKVNDATWKVRFDDWMFLMPDGKNMFNKATIYRWGIRLGDVYIFFSKE